MPKPKAGESQDDYMSRCIPMVMEEGTASDNKQAAAVCASMFRQHMKKSVKDESLMDRMDAIYHAFNVQFPQDMAMPVQPMMGGYVDEIFDDYVIVENGGKKYKASYSTDADGKVTFAPMVEWQEVSEVTTFEPVKIGARNSRRDLDRLQGIHDYAVENGAICKGGKALDPDEVLVFDGAEVKALGQGRVGGYLVRFSTAGDPDLTQEYFTPETDYGDADKTAVLYHHGLDTKVGRRKIGSGTLTRDDVGIWVEAQLGLRDEYEKVIYQLAEAGKLGWSSGTASHLVEKDETGKILSWPLGLDASLTPTPAEPRNAAVPLKSLVTPLEPDRSGSDTQQARQVEPNKENSDMDENTLKAMLDERDAKLEAKREEQVNAAAKKAVNDVLDKLPEVKAKLGAQVEVTVAEEDRPFKSVGENLIAVANAVKGKGIHPRIKGLKALDLGIKAPLGMNEATPSQGEFLLEPTIGQDLLKPLHDTGVFYTQVGKLPVGPNSNSGWENGIDETSRAAGSRWGGVRGYHSAEAGSMTGSKPKFRRINWELHKVYVLQYATDELLQDAARLTAIINQSAAEELDFMVNDDILNGIGGDRPVGVLQSNCLVAVTRQDANKIYQQDLTNMWMRMPARSKANAKWYINGDVQGQLDALTFTSGSTALLSPFVNYGPDGVMRIYGKPVVETEFNASLGTQGDIVLADMSQYLFWEKGGVEAASSIHIEFLTDETVFRFIKRYDGQTALHSALTPYKGSNTTSPFVALTASS